MYDLFIVGAGPVGCYFARNIEGCSYNLIEEHREVGVPVQCAGLVGEKIFRYVKKKYFNKINGAHIRYKGDSFPLRKKGVAYVIDREEFDKNLSRGVDISFEERFLAARRKDDAVKIKTTKGIYHAKYLVGCDGPRSRVRRYVTSQEPRYLTSLQRTIRYRHDPDMISFFLRPFSWIIPENEEICRVGTISDHPSRVMPSYGGDVLQKTGGLIPVGLLRTYRDKVLVIGDAAAQVKPLTGGGLYYGMRAAEIAGNLFSEERIEEYDAAWRGVFGNQIRFGLLGRTIYENISEKNMTRFYEFIKENREKIEASCEFDRHSSLLKIILSSPKAWPLFLMYTGELMRDYWSENRTQKPL